MRRWLVTGGCGFIGSHFTRLLLRERQDAAVLNLDALTYAGRVENVADCASNPNYRFVQANVAERAQVEEAWRGFQPDVVVHFAAESHVDRSIADAAPFIRTNVQGVQVLLDVARRHRAARVIHVSTDEVYGNTDAPQGADEATPMAPNSPYAASKAAGDLLVRAAVQTYGLPAVITRGSNTYGPNQFPEKLLPLAITRALANRPIPLYGDGNHVRSWVEVGDHCRGILSAAEFGSVGAVYNLGGESEITNRALLEMLLELMGRSRELIQAVVDRPGHDRRYRLDCRRAARELGWQPRQGLREGLRHTVTWYSRHPGWFADAGSAEP